MEQITFLPVDGLGLCIQRDSVAAGLAGLSERALGGCDELDVLPRAFAIGQRRRHSKGGCDDGVVGDAGFGFFRLSTASRSRSASTIAPVPSVPPSTTPNFPAPPYLAITSPGR